MINTLLRFFKTKVFPIFRDLSSLKKYLTFVTPVFIALIFISPILFVFVNAGSTLVGGIGLTQFFIQSQLTSEERNQLIAKTRTDYVVLEHLNNNILITDCYQKADQMNLFHLEKPQKPWYNFWQK